MLFSTLRRAWRAFPGRTVLLRLPAVRALLSAAHRAAPHDELYTAEYYAEMDERSRAATDVMAAGLVRVAAPDSVLDVGCGTGALLRALRDRGVPGTGLEHSAAALEVARRHGLDVEAADLRAGVDLDGRRFGAAVCMEVAEHLPARSADGLVALLADAADVVLFSAATPGQGGTGHVNEQPHAYWIARFRRRGFAVDEAATSSLRAEWAAADVPWWYARNVMLFRRAGDA